MLNTSHFLGYFFSPSIFAPLYVSLKQYLESKMLTNDIVMQDIHSIHTTIYYFEKDISPNDRAAIQSYIKATNAKHPNFCVGIHSFSYFEADNQKKVLYLVPLNQVLSDLNAELVKLFSRNEIVDNQFTFTPHISLLKIYNPDLFTKHSSAIEKLINTFLLESNLNIVSGDLRLYAAYSQFTPELQLPSI